jgi:hypothetical protein
LVRLAWEPPFGGVLDVTARTVRNEEQTSPLQPYERAYDIGASYSRALRGYSVGAEFLVGKDIFGENFSRVGGYVRFTDEWSLGGAVRRGFGEIPRRQRGAELFFDAGFNLSKVEARIDGNQNRLRTGQELAPHFAIGARRPFSERSDIGVRLELDRINDEILLAARLLDYRYRFRNPLAVSLFFGAARYDLATPAFGYYLGGGVQWRNLFKNIDLSLDVRYADKVARDKLLPNDDTSLVRPDSFFDISGATLGLSYRF